MEQYPDVVDSYFGLLSRVRKYYLLAHTEILITLNRLLEDVHLHYINSPMK